ncbi:MAG: hypothetical protein AABZ32_02645, partial [Bacteroidota bacterium]
MTEKENNITEIEKMLKDMAEAGQKISKAYLDSMPNLIHSAKDVMSGLASLAGTVNSNPTELSKLQNAYLNFYKKQIGLWQEINQHTQQGGSQPLPNGDKRFKSPDWNEAPYYFYYIKQTYLMASELLHEIIEQSAIEDTAKKKLKFYSQLY